MFAYTMSRAAEKQSFGECVRIVISVVNYGIIMRTDVFCLGVRRMKYLKQLFLILLFSFLGEILKELIPLPIPASIYGMALMLISLLSGLIKLEQVRETGKFLIEVMPVMFIPAGVGLMDSWDVLRPLLVPVLVITVVSLMTVMAVSGRLAQAVIRRNKKKETDHGE